MGELLATLSADELADWMAYDRIEPFGPWREDMRAAMTTTAVYNAAGCKPTSKPSEFLLSAPEPKSDKPAPDLAEKLHRILGGMVT